MVENNRFAIVGTGGHSIAAFDAAMEMNKYEFIGWIDSFKAQNDVVQEYKVLGHPDQIQEIVIRNNLKKVFLGISNNYIRREVWENLKSKCPSLELVSIIHPESVISKMAKIDEGVLVMAGAIINAGCHVGHGAIVNTAASLDHDSVVKPFSSILPGVTTGGNVNIGVCTCVCIGSIISHGVSIGDHTYVGAGSLVLNDIPDHVLAYGSPAVPKCKRNESDKHF
jgi:sugar O-acyltransferase (sialic acid O-acetyltransferase NeuD family)